MRCTFPFQFRDRWTNKLRRESRKPQFQSSLKVPLRLSLVQTLVDERSQDAAFENLNAQQGSLLSPTPGQ